MLTPIKKQGDEHIYILLQISIINWISVRYVDILRFVWMLIGSEITYGDALSILYEVHVKGNHADGDKVLLKKSCHVITPAAAKARSAQVLRNSPRAMPLLGFTNFGESAWMFSFLLCDVYWMTGPPFLCESASIDKATSLFSGDC